VLVQYRDIILTLSLLEATDFAHVTIVDQDQPAHLPHLIMLCNIIMVSIICYSICTYFEIFPENDKRLCPE
jgi:hypothetical protein